MKTKKICVTVTALLLLCVMGAWTPYNAAESQERYADAPLLSMYATETISFTSKKIAEQYSTPGNAPKYSPISGLTNSCGAVAGATIVGFYDKYFPNLITGWDSHFPTGDKYRRQDAVYVPALMRELYTLMRTNVDDVGVSESDFKNGLQQYVQNKGYNIAYRAMASGGAIDYSAAKQALNNNNVLVLFAKECDVYRINEGTSSDTLTPVHIAGLHIMVAYGYKQIQYSNARGAFRTDTYLRVMIGKDGATEEYYNISAKQINAAYAVIVS